MVRHYSLDKMRRIIGEDDVNNATTNKRLREAGESSQSEFLRITANIDITFNESVKELISSGGVAYFYNRENADAELRKLYTEAVKDFVKTGFGRPKFLTRGTF